MLINNKTDLLVNYAKNSELPETRGKMDKKSVP